MGAVASQTGNTDKALKHWRIALTIKPNDVKLMHVMAVEYGKGLYFGEAVAVANRALSLDASDPNLYLVAIKAHQNANSHVEALKIADQMVRTLPRLARSNFEYAYELDRSGRSADAVTFLQRAVSLDPAYEQPYFL